MVTKNTKSSINRYLNLHRFNLSTGLSVMRSQWRSILISTLIVSASLLGLRIFGAVESLELLVFDYLTRIQPEQSTEPDVLVLEITEADIQKYGWPLSDQVLALVINQLQQSNPQVIGLDLYRNIPHPPGTQDLQVQFESNNLIAIKLIGGNLDKGDIPAPSSVPNERVGFNDLVVDEDGIIRRSLLFVKTTDQEFAAFALLVVLKYLGIDNVNIQADGSLAFDSTAFSPLPPTIGGYQKLDHRGYQMLLRYQSIDNVANKISITQLLNETVDPSWITGKIVLIGTTAPSIKDLFFTPYSVSQNSEFLMPGVWIHAQIINQILNVVSGETRLYWFLPQWAENIWLMLWITVGSLIVWWIRSPVILTGSVGLMIFSIVGTSWFAFMQIGWIPVAEPLLGLGAAVGLTLMQRLHYSTSRDQLTGLLNQDTFLKALKAFTTQNALDTNWSELTAADDDYGFISDQNPSSPLLSAVLFLDLDRFKIINESLGHHMGNHVLLDVVGRIQGNLPASALLARVGGDEFAVFLRHMHQERIFDVVDTIQGVLAKPFVIDIHSALLSISTGIVFIQPGHCYSAEHLLRDAHTAMYRAKGLGRSGYQVFAKGMLLEVVSQLELETDLQRGIDAKEFCLYYQPIICLQTGRIRGFEALVRWQHPTKGFVPPNAFIPVAEETGLIIPLGLWIFQQACCQLKEWEPELPEGASLMMSINLSGRQFEQPELVEALQKILQQVNIQHQAFGIKLEITESMLMSDVDVAIDMMLRLKNLNLKLGIDDFGTGYSSLSYLHRFPVDTLKVDQSFVRKMEASSENYDIVDTIITLAHKLSMDVIAEGIETEEQKQIIQRLGGEYGQGYLFSKPLPSDAATNLLRKNPKW
ncbi:MAG: EAL domain-containing protein [Cyanobacteria bacterium P01_F01_bin.150]